MKIRGLIFGFLLTGTFCMPSAMSLQPGPGPGPDLSAAVKSSIDRGLRYLWAQQEKNGSWRNDPGLTGLILKAFVESPRRYVEEDGPFIRRPIQFIAASAQPSGAITRNGTPYLATAQALLGLQSTKNPRYDGLIERAGDFLQKAPMDALGKSEPRTVPFMIMALEHSGADPLLLQPPKSTLRRNAGQFEDESYHSFYFKVNLGDGKDFSADSLMGKILGLQDRDGSWVGSGSSWQEDDPVVATCLAILTLERLSNP